MPSDSHQQQPEVSANDKKINTESLPLLTSEEVKAGTKVIMTHAGRQAYVKTSGLGELFGVADLLPNVGETAPEVDRNSPNSKRAGRSIKRNKQSPNDSEMTA